MDYSAIYKKVEEYVTKLFERTPHPKLFYHNLQHTVRVVGRTKEIAAHYHLIENDMLVLTVAAWFHDTGYLFDEVSLHEEKSAQLMREFMKDEVTDADLLNNIEECIMATKASIKPANLLQQILVDADTYNFGTKELLDTTNKQVYDEFVGRNGYISKKEWNRQTVKMLENHHYYTSYTKELLTDRKKKNIKKLKKNIEEAPEEAKQPLIPDKQSLKAANNLTTKGIQTMLRLTSENHMKLSDMADGKANILISVNAIIISVILSVLMRRLQQDAYLTIPTIIFLSSSVCTIVVAILATRPKVSSGRFSEQDIDSKKTNLLFFGNFYKCSQEEYERAMSKMMVDSEYLYGSLVKDIYQLGVVLARKYRLIRWAYNIFMFGIIISVIAFAIAVIMSTNADAITSPAGSPL
ncbi:MAG: metal-dependent phosphohydrolase sub domain protein [Segetibacter sp.]|jgi:HD superfamily phosphodiesterase|nr:metal-dependent phosphohydrolase sub domain protein [Segetibacter sp.]